MSYPSRYVPLQPGPRGVPHVHACPGCGLRDATWSANTMPRGWEDGWCPRCVRSPKEYLKREPWRRTRGRRAAQ